MHTQAEVSKSMDSQQLLLVFPGVSLTALAGFSNLNDFLQLSLLHSKRYTPALLADLHASTHPQSGHWIGKLCPHGRWSEFAQLYFVVLISPVSVSVSIKMMSVWRPSLLDWPSI